MGRDGNSETYRQNYQNSRFLLLLLYKLQSIITYNSKDTSLKDAIYERIGEIESRAFNAEQALKWINSTVQAHNLLFKDGKLKSDLFPSEEKLMTSQGNDRIDASYV